MTTEHAEPLKITVGELMLQIHDIAAEGETSCPPLVMLHGGGAGASSWSNFRQNVPELSMGRRLILVDQPGFGGSSKLDLFAEPFFSVSAKALASLLDELDIDEVDVLGNSLGGGASVRFALDYPERVRRLVLMAPGGVSLPVHSPEPSEGLRLLASCYTVPELTVERLEQFLRVMVYDQDLVTEQLVEERYSKANDEASRRSGLAALQSVMAREHGDEAQLWRRLEEVRHRTLLVWGRDDRVLPFDGAFFPLKRLRDARLLAFSRCGHWAQLEKRDEFDRHVRAFLAE